MCRSFIRFRVFSTRVALCGHINVADLTKKKSDRLQSHSIPPFLRFVLTREF